MLIRKFDPAQLVDAYDVKEQMFYPCSEVAATPFGSAWLVVEPGRRTKPHNHHEGETFIILRGRGRMTVGEETRPVEPGDVIYLPPFGDHILENESLHEDLHFLTIWWEDAAAVAKLKEKAGGAPPRRRRVLVSAGAGARLDAQIHARYVRLCGGRVSLLDEEAGDAPAAGGADAAAARDLFGRLQAAGRVVLRSQPEPGLFFDPAPHAQAVARHADRVAMSPRLRTLVDGALASGLAEVAVSRVSSAGVELPLPGLAAHRFDPRFVRAARLLGRAREGAGGPAAPDRELAEETIVFVAAAADEPWFHAVLLPALAEAAAIEYAPAALIAGVAGREGGEGRLALADLAAGGAAGVPADWLDWLASLEAKVARDHRGVAPPTQAWTPGQQVFVGQLQRLAEEVAAAYQPATFSPRRAARLLRELVAAARDLAEREEPWSRVGTRREETSTAVAVELLAAKVLAVLAYPLLPDWSSRLWSGLGYSSALDEEGRDALAAWEETPTFVPTGHPVQGLAAAVHAAVPA
jgi:mannose-6-phosphate isomerase-like protein (cupin superfamily)